MVRLGLQKSQRLQVDAAKHRAVAEKEEIERKWGRAQLTFGKELSRPELAKLAAIVGFATKVCWLSNWQSALPCKSRCTAAQLVGKAKNTGAERMEHYLPELAKLAAIVGLISRVRLLLRAQPVLCRKAGVQQPAQLVGEAERKSEHS